MSEVQYEKLIKIPALAEDTGSLTAMEKSLLAHFILLARPRVIIELGVFHAMTTQFMCELLIENGIDGCVVGFDLPEVINKLRQNNESVQRLEALQRLQLVPGRLPHSLVEWLNNSPGQFDFALIDATHDYHNVLGELNWLWPRLSVDGYILCHDYSSKYDGVRCAVDRFASANDAMLLPLSASEAALHAGHWSCLVAMARKPSRLTIGRLMPHWWISAKISLLDNPLFEKLWRQVRPFVQRN